MKKEPQQRYKVEIFNLDARKHFEAFIDMLNKTENFSFRQRNNLYQWAVVAPSTPHGLGIPAASHAMAEVLAQTCETMGASCTIEPISQEAYDYLYQGIGGEAEEPAMSVDAAASDSEPGFEGMN